MPVYIAEGDLLKSDCNAIAHQANCFGKMGAGIARQIRLRYPEAYEADLNFRLPVGSRERLGHYSWCWVDGGSRLVANLYGQYGYGPGRHTDYDAFETALSRLVETLILIQPQLNVKYKLGLPFGIGAGLAGGNWTQIFSIIRRVSGLHSFPIYLYKLKKD